jgi:CO/xanthine dehydrogenase Mo-binding subunit
MMGAGFPDARVLGRDVPRVEDAALIRGAGRFVDDIARRRGRCRGWPRCWCWRTWRRT